MASVRAVTLQLPKQVHGLDVTSSFLCVTKRREKVFAIHIKLPGELRRGLGGSLTRLDCVAAAACAQGRHETSCQFLSPLLFVLFIYFLNSRIPQAISNRTFTSAAS